MIDLKRKQGIILDHINGLSNREIARKLHISKDTVNKYVNEYEEKKRELLALNPDMDPEELIQAIVEKPAYDTSRRGPKTSTEEARKIIEQCLIENEKKRSSGRRKQQMKKIDIHAYLLKQGYDISYSTVKLLVRQIEETHKEAFIRQEYEYGDISEFDWGEASLDIDGTGYQKYQLAVFTAAKTNNRFAKLYMKQDTAAFQESHAEYFSYCRGVFHTMVYDNMRVAVAKFVGPSEKEPTEALLKLSIYYGFQFRFCNIRSGNEKGHVERSVEYVRRKAFSEPDKDQFQTLAEANEYLAQKCRELNNEKLSDGTIPAETFEEERKFLLPDLPKFESFKNTSGHVDKYSTICVERNHYSVPDTLVGKTLEVRVYTNKIVIKNAGRTVAVHERCFDTNQWRIDIYHYLRTLKRKPGALPKSTALLQADTRIQKIYDTYYSSDAKNFLDVLEIIKEKGIDAVEEALLKLITISPGDMSADKVRMLCSVSEKEETAADTPGTDHLSIKSQQTLSQYDILRQLQNKEERIAV